MPLDLFDVHLLEGIRTSLREILTQDLQLRTAMTIVPQGAYRSVDITSGALAPGSGAPASVSLYGVVLGRSRPQLPRDGAGESDADQIHVAVMVSDLGSLDPKPDDLLLVAGRKYAIVAVGPEPSGSLLFLEARRRDAA